MAGIALADLNGGKARRRPGFVIPNSEHVGNAAGFERPPDLRRAGDAFEEPGFVNGLVLRRASEDRIVAVQDRLHAHERPFLRVVGVIAHPFAEWAFVRHEASKFHSRSRVWIGLGKVSRQAGSRRKAA